MSFNFNRPFSRDADGDENGIGIGGGGGAFSSAPASKYFGNEDARRRHWRSFLADLETACDDDDGDEGPHHVSETEAGTSDPPEARREGGMPSDSDVDINSSSDNISGSSTSIVNSLYMQQLRGNYSLGGGGLCVESTTPTEQRKTAAAPAALPKTLPLREWVAHHKAIDGRRNPSRLGRGGGIDRTCLESATRVALSLAKRVEGRHCSRDDLIVIEDVIVSDASSGDVEFVDDAIVAPPPPSEDSRSSSPRGRQGAVRALGVIFYEVFTLGSRPSSGAKRPEPTATGSPPEPSSFDAALKIDGGDDDRAAGERRKQPRRSPDGEGRGRGGRYADLQLAGLPPSICRLVSHMLESAHRGHEEGGLFHPDRPAVSLSDVVADLRQMVDDPHSFLHDSLLLRLEPVVPNRKLYGRGNDLRRCLDVARAVSCLDREPSGTTERPRQRAIMISGFGGCGKSSLAREAAILLEVEGWQCLHCKFDQEARPRPLSTISSAFDNFLADVACKLDGDVRREVADRMNGLLDGDDVDELCQLIPTLRRLAVAKDVCRPEPSDGMASFNTRDAAASKCRLHRLFGLLVRALSDHVRPLLICMDDLQWADEASLELVNSLLSGVLFDEKLTPRKCGGSHMLFVGAFRGDEVASGSRPLDACIQKMKDCASVSLEEIHLGGLSSRDVNDLVSDALRYPRRLTRSLSELIHNKSTGNPLFVKEFLANLAAENLLTYSLSRHAWIWDEDVIEMRAVSNGVVDLLTSRLGRLPRAALSALEVMSCIGHDVSSRLLIQLGEVCGSSDIVGGLDLAHKELLVRKSQTGDGCVYGFVHDTVQNTVYRGIGQPERDRMLKEIADALISGTSSEERGSSDDTILFVIVDLINRASWSRSALDADDRSRYAEFNLLAGEKAIQTPDFSSAIEYIQSGISFLGDGHWEEEYDLSLALFKSAAAVACTLGKSNQMTRSLDTVFDNAQCYEDKLDSMSVLVQSLLMDDKPKVALDRSLEVLRHIGEPVPEDLDREAIRKEIIETHNCVHRISLASLNAIPVMTDNMKIKAMHFLNLSLWSTSHQKSTLFAIVSCRMVRLTVAHGLNFYSSSAIAALAYTMTVVLRNYTEAYKLGKMALAINKSPKMVAEIALVVTNNVCIYKEPIQALLPIILENYRIAVKWGAMNSACLNSTCYIGRAFLSGSPLASLDKELVVFLCEMSRHNRIRQFLCSIPISNAIAGLTGEPRHDYGTDVQEYEDNERNLWRALEQKDLSRCEIVILLQILENFIFRRMDLAEKAVRQYQEFLDLQGSVHGFYFIYRSFYSGLVAFHCFRETRDRYWMDQGRKSMREMETLANECTWNFHNKYLLLKAEYHFSVGDFDEAANLYHLSITSARDHRFICEEAIANELTAHFQLERGRDDLSMLLLGQSIECYETWGAMKKAERLKSYCREKQS